MYKNLIELFKENEGKGAVGAFNLHCFEMLPAMIKAAEEINVPIIIQTSLGTAEYIGFEPLIAAVKALAEKSTVSVALHMDHCKDIEKLKKAIDCGYSSVMYDGSSLPIEENIKNTKEVVAYAHERGVSVEGEVGSIGGAEEGVVVAKDDAMYTKPEDALYFATETGVDALAVSIGTTHGQYKSKAKINYELLTELKTKLGDTGLVLHGGTGVSDEDMKRCVREGMKKINVGTELNKSYIEVVNTTFPDATPLTSLRNLLGPANEKIKDIILECLDYEDYDDNYEVSLSFVDNKEIHELNKEYRGIDRATDVLSFPLLVEDEFGVDFGEESLGDIVISLERAFEQSREYNHSFEREVCFLVCHSMFHLLGYDHDTEENTKEMRQKEEYILNKLGITRE